MVACLSSRVRHGGRWRARLDLRVAARGVGGVDEIDEAELHVVGVVGAEHGLRGADSDENVGAGPAEDGQQGGGDEHEQTEVRGESAEASPGEAVGVQEGGVGEERCERRNGGCEGPWRGARDR